MDLTDWVEKVARVNTDADLNAKCVPAFLNKGKLLAAVKSAICMKEKHAGHPKTGATLAKLFKSWLEMDEAARLDACGKDQRILTVVGREIADLGCPAVTGDITTWFEANRASENSNTKLSECHEAIKLRYRQLD